MSSEDDVLGPYWPEGTPKSGLVAPRPWTLASGWEQEDPGWHVVAANGAVVVVLHNEVPLTRAEATCIVEALNAIPEAAIKTAVQAGRTSVLPSA